MAQHHGPHYYIVVYDAQQKQLPKVLKTLRRYLHWVQNSVFEGELTRSQFLRLRQELRDIIDPEQDSVILYRFSHRWLDRETLGVEKGNIGMIL